MSCMYVSPSARRGEGSGSRRSSSSRASGTRHTYVRSTSCRSTIESFESDTVRHVRYTLQAAPRAPDPSRADVPMQQRRKHLPSLRQSLRVAPLSWLLYTQCRPSAARPKPLIHTVASHSFQIEHIHHNQADATNHFRLSRYHRHPQQSYSPASPSFPSSCACALPFPRYSHPRASASSSIPSSPRQWQSVLDPP